VIDNWHQLVILFLQKFKVIVKSAVVTFQERGINVSPKRVHTSVADLHGRMSFGLTQSDYLTENKILP